MRPTVGQVPAGTATPCGIERVVEVVEPHAGADRDRARGLVDGDLAHRRDVEHEVGSGRPAAVAVAAAADRDSGAVVAAQPEDRGHVAHVGGLDDRPRRDRVVDRVVEHVRERVVAVGRGDDPAVDLLGELVDRRRAGLGGGRRAAERRRRAVAATTGRRRACCRREDRGCLGRGPQEVAAFHATTLKRRAPPRRHPGAKCATSLTLGAAAGAPRVGRVVRSRPGANVRGRPEPFCWLEFPWRSAAPGAATRPRNVRRSAHRPR